MKKTVLEFYINIKFLFCGYIFFWIYFLNIYIYNFMLVDPYGSDPGSHDHIICIHVRG